MQSSFDTLTHARLFANTTSLGSSPTRSVARTFSVVRSTMLTSSDSVFTTQASVFERAATDTGSSPTGTSATRTGEGPVTSNTLRRLSGVFTTSTREPSGVIASGWTWPLSKWVNDAGP